MSVAAVVALVGCVFYFIYRSMKDKSDDDGPQRRAGNPAPEWVRLVGPIVFLFLVYVVFTCRAGSGYAVPGEIVIAAGAKR